MYFAYTISHFRHSHEMATAFVGKIVKRCGKVKASVVTWQTYQTNDCMRDFRPLVANAHSHIAHTRATRWPGWVICSQRDGHLHSFRNWDKWNHRTAGRAHSWCEAVRHARIRGKTRSRHNFNDIMAANGDGARTRLWQPSVFIVHSGHRCGCLCVHYKLQLNKNYVYVPGIRMKSRHVISSVAQGRHISLYGKCFYLFETRAFSLCI